MLVCTVVVVVCACGMLCDCVAVVVGVWLSSFVCVVCAFVCWLLLCVRFRLVFYVYASVFVPGVCLVCGFVCGV